MDIILKLLSSLPTALQVLGLGRLLLTGRKNIRKWPANDSWIIFQPYLTNVFLSATPHECAWMAHECSWMLHQIIFMIHSWFIYVHSCYAVGFFVCDATRMCMNEARMLTNNFMSATLHALGSAACYQRDARMCMNEARMCMNIHETFMAICGRLSDTVGWWETGFNTISVNKAEKSSQKIWW